MLNGQSKMKLRCCVTFQQIKIEEKIRSKIEYGEHFLILTSFPNNSTSTKTTSKKIDGKEIPETPKFFSNNKSYIINQSKEKEQIFSMQKILKRIDLL